MNNINHQLLTSFPNRNDKHIDFVLVYDKLEATNFDTFENKQKWTVRRAFFDRLRAEKIDTYVIEQSKYNKTRMFALLSCSKERLLEEAELIRLELTLKNVSCLNLHVLGNAQIVSQRFIIFK
jgi:hypothetical protein